MNIGIVGNGYVGQATKMLGCRDDFSDLEDNAMLIYDIDKDKCLPSDITFKDLSLCDVVFVCVPTPANADGTCSTLAVESVVHELKEIGGSDIIVRSTVPVGTCRKLEVNFMPEFLTERQWEKDVKNTQEWIVGLWNAEDKYLKKILRKIFITAKRNGRIKSANFIWASTEEAELAKLVRNAFLATKVSFFNEIHSFCEAVEIPYERVVNLVRLDPRIGESHMQVPGPDGKKGYGGTCLPKDINSLYHQIFDQGIDPSIIDAVMLRNQKIDRPEEDWKDDKGRAVV